MADTAPPIHNWLAGDDFNADRMNEIGDQITFLRNPPMVHVARTITSQTLGQGWNFISFDTVVNSYDPYGMFDSGSPDRISGQVAGWYTVEAQMSLNQTSNEGRLILGVYKNGTGGNNLQLRSDVQNFPGAGAVAWTKEFMVFLNVGDWLQLGHWFFMDTSRTTISGSVFDRSRLRARWVSN